MVLLLVASVISLFIGVIELPLQELLSGNLHLWEIFLVSRLPRLLAILCTGVGMSVAGLIMSAAGLSFIGLGVQPPTPEWGNILNTGLDNVSVLAERWHTIVFPALFIILTMLAFNLLGDGLRDAMDPRMRK